MSTGSIWRKWDLQIHTPASYLNNQFSGSWDDYVRTVFRRALEKEISVLGITDYFTIEGYKKIRSEYLSDSDKMRSLFTEDEVERIYKILILPNVEFRLATFVGDDSVNFHVIFSDDIPIRDIEEHFLHDLDFVYQGNIHDEDEKKKLKIDNLERLGQRLKKEHEPFRDELDIVVGMKNAVVRDEQIVKKLRQSKSVFRGRYLLALPSDEDLSRISWDSQAHQSRKVLVQKSDVLFTSNENTRNWALGEPPYMEGEDAYIAEFLSLKPCLHGSDAHVEWEIGHPCAKRGEQGHDCSKSDARCDVRFCWIKADPTFEGLRQTLYEPEDRVRIQMNDPSPLKHSYSICAIEIGDNKIADDLSIEGKYLDFNQDLVAIAGGKGTGKTALVDLIAHHFVDREKTKDQNSFVRRIAKQAPGLKTELVFANGDQFPKELLDGQFFEGSPIEYIPQAGLEEFVGEESDIEEHVNQIIVDSPHVRDTTVLHDFLSVQDQTSIQSTDIHTLNKEIVALESACSEEKVKHTNKKTSVTEASLKDVREKIQTVKVRIGPDQHKEAEKKQVQLGELRTKKSNLNELKELLTETKAFVSNDVASANNDIAKINRLLKQLNLETRLTTIKNPSKTEIEQIQSGVEKSLRETVFEIEKFQKELEKVTEDIRLHTTLLDKEKEYEKNLQDVRDAAKKIEEARQELTERKAQRKKQYKELMETILSARERYEKVIEQFKSKEAAVLSDLDFVTEIEFDDETYVSRAKDILDKRSAKIDKTKEDFVFHDLLKLIENLLENGGTSIHEYVEEVQRLSETLYGLKKQSEAISFLDFYDLIFGNYFSIEPVVRYKKTNVNKLSLGQKSTVLVKIYLAQGDRPIIIDSHDDHLDNEFIMDELVFAVRQAKKQRQVFLVSNNGNVVVNSDAEQVILASRSDEGRISYASGALEEPSIRSRAIDILEGGEKAFRKRQEKYRIPTNP